MVVGAFANICLPIPDWKGNTDLPDYRQTALNNDRIEERCKDFISLSSRHFPDFKWHVIWFFHFAIHRFTHLTASDISTVAGDTGPAIESLFNIGGCGNSSLHIALKYSLHCCTAGWQLAPEEVCDQCFLSAESVQYFQ